LSWEIKARFEYAVKRSGPLSMAVNQSGGFFRGHESQTQANLQVYFTLCLMKYPKALMPS
jgi:choline dehydrogenase